jgi:uncharacterized protein (DUF305 family)
MTAHPKRPRAAGKDMKAALKPLLGLIALSLMVGVAACGEEETTTRASEVVGNGVDRAFVAEMIPHHRSAVEMAEIAERRSKRTEIKELAQAIIATQNAEIDKLQRLDQRLADAGVETGELGMAAHEMGTDMDTAGLREAEPFDREFIDAMIPHHQGAIRMAQMQLEQGENREVGRLAEAIVQAQSAEIDQMNEWRVDWFGGLSPAGGVPGDGGHMGHGG